VREERTATRGRRPRGPASLRWDLPAPPEHARDGDRRYGEEDDDDVASMETKTTALLATFRAALRSEVAKPWKKLEQNTACNLRADLDVISLVGIGLGCVHVLVFLRKGAIYASYEVVSCGMCRATSSLIWISDTH